MTSPAVRMRAAQHRFYQSPGTADLGRFFACFTQPLLDCGSDAPSSFQYSFQQTQKPRQLVQGSFAVRVHGTHDRGTERSIFQCAGPFICSSWLALEPART